uniref:CCHC-type domain-containing protein n=1 Tax=Tanacetum cinerariifolium TaxID=118510 RepID=A0A6L2LQ47_TANCI|nr:hypothetical protein [Tanacetum cinerariifolium]
MVIDSSTTLERTYHRWLSRISKPYLRTDEFKDWVKLSDHKQALRGRQPMIILVIVMNKCVVDINQIDEDDMEEMDIKWNMALLSMRADKFWKRTGKKISIQGSNVSALKHSKKLETLKQEKEGVDRKLAGLLTASKDLDNLIESQRSDKNKEGLGYTDVPPPPVQLYLSPKKDLSWTGLPKCPDVVMKKKACFNCGNFNHLAYDCKKRVKMNFTPRPVTNRPYRPSQRPMRTNMNGASPNKTSLNKQAHSYGNRPFHRTLAVRSPYRPPWVSTVNRYFLPVNRKFSTGSRNFPTANRKFPTASRKFPTGSTKSPTADMGIKEKAVKPSACWSWKPSHNLTNKGPKNDSVSVMFKKYTYIDTQGRLKSVMAWVPKKTNPLLKCAG